jgi:hypothetical protein
MSDDMSGKDALQAILLLLPEPAEARRDRFRYLISSVRPAMEETEGRALSVTVKGNLFFGVATVGMPLMVPVAEMVGGAHVAGRLDIECCSRSTFQHCLD